VALQEASETSFKDYGKQVVANAQALAQGLKEGDLRLVSGGTDNHMVLVDFGEAGPSGKEIQDALSEVDIIVNRNTVPRETRKPFVTSGIRLGTPAVTTRGMKENELKQIAELIVKVVESPQEVQTKMKEEAEELTKKFPLP
jgi:glycine hydroxymethyltransferase